MGLRSELAPGDYLKIVLLGYMRSNNVHISCSCKFTRADDCVDEGSEEDIMGLCNGRRECTIDPASSLFGDPCPGMVNYVEVENTCVPERKGIT